MKFGLLARKLMLDEDRFTGAGKIKEYCEKLGISYNAAISYLLKYGYVKRIVRGFFYVPTAGERKLKTKGVSHLEAIARAMEHKGVRNWYYGLETAAKLNNLTHEYFAEDCVVSDRIFRPRPISVLGHKVKFIRLNGKLFGFGTKKYGLLPYSDVEKTILDIVHLGKYGGRSNEKLREEITDLLEHASKRRLAEYAKRYSKSVRHFVGELTA